MPGTIKPSPAPLRFWTYAATSAPAAPITNVIVCALGTFGAAAARRGVRPTCYSWCGGEQHANHADGFAVVMYPRMRVSVINSLATPQNLRSIAARSALLFRSAGLTAGCASNSRITSSLFVAAAYQRAVLCRHAGLAPAWINSRAMAAWP